MDDATPSSQPIPEIGDGHRLGRYEIIEPLSKGAMGAVYHARNTVDGQEVAIKRLLDPRHATRFEIEARLLSSLEHPRVVKVTDHFQDPGGAYYLVMDLVRGIDLGQLLKQQGKPGLPPRDAIRLTMEACEALNYVHEQQIVHRDVKPQNLILGEDGVVLVDFGVAREIGEEESGTVGIGTPRFMAPEVFAGGQLSPRSDVFGLAATLWTLLAGKPPVYADDTQLAEVVPGVTPELEATVRAGLEMVPERRVASIAAFAKALGQPLKESRGQSLVLSLPSPDAPRTLIESVVRTAAGIFEASAASIALVDRTTGELVFQASWGAGAKEIVGVRLPPGVGLAGSVIERNEGIAVPDCRTDPRFAAQIAKGTGYVPHTMVVVPLKRSDKAIGVMSLLDRRDGENYGPDDVRRATLFAELALAALDVSPDAFTSLGETTLGPHR